MSSKYKQGDVVEFGGQKAKVIAVNEEDYFFGDDHTYYTYDLEFFSDGCIQKGVTEPALQGIVTAEPVKKRRLCECGAWSVAWASEEHSDWCPGKFFTPHKEKK